MLVKCAITLEKYSEICMVKVQIKNQCEELELTWKIKWIIRNWIINSKEKKYSIVIQCLIKTRILLGF